ncbi:MAG: restriction endonuclease subunit S [Akkermansiaceae bacterium]|nr:restriction endonuclease subunit S [Akkermansiaceae bacterium]
MNANWNPITLGDFVAMQRGHDLTASERRPGTIPVFGAAGQNGFHDTALAKGPGIVIGRCGGSFGQVHFCDTDFWPHNTGLYVTDFKGNDPYFAYYLLKWLDFDSYNSGSAQPSLNRNFIYPIRIRVPNPREQHRIAAVLSALDAKIELNHRINAELEGLAKLLYDYWFVHFEFPLTAAQAAALGKPKLAGHPYQSSGGPMVHDPQLKRKIPKGWKVGPIADLCHLNQRAWGTANAPASVIYLDLANVKNGEILDFQEYEWVKAPSRARRILTHGDTIIGTVRPGNRSFAMVPKSAEILTGSTGFAVLTPRAETYREYNYLALTSDVNIERLTVVASGAAYPAVNPEAVAAHTIAQPDQDSISRFHSAARSAFSLIENNNQQTQELTALRDWLLPLLMNGQVRVG